jgi:hypothetical protein
MNDRLDVLMMVVKMDVSRGLRRSDRLDDHLKGGDHHDVPVGHRMNGTDDLNDLMTDVNHVSHSCVHRDPKTDVNLDVSHDHHMNDRLDDRKTDDDRRDALDGHYKNVMDDLMMVVKTDVSRDRRKSDLLDDHSMVGNRVNRNYVPRDLMTDVNLGVMNHRGK